MNLIFKTIKIKIVNTAQT